MTTSLSTFHFCSVIFIFSIGLIILLKLLFRVLQIFWIYLLSNCFGSGVKWCGGQNTWAVITGATDGIGLAYAEAMAEKGYNLLLMSRNSRKLNEIKRKIEECYENCAEIKTLSVDFRKTDIYANIKEELKKLGEIHVLINNVGMTYGYPEFLIKMENSAQFLTDIINVNIYAMTQLINIILPQMVMKKRGIIINVSSIAALTPTPLLSIYSATKAYGDYISRALNAEYSHRGIIIQSVLPYYVSTDMIKNPKLSIMVASAEEYVKSALKTVGRESRTHGYFQHTLLALFHNILTFFIGDYCVTKLVFCKLKSIRDKYCKKRLIFEDILNEKV